MKCLSGYQRLESDRAFCLSRRCVDGTVRAKNEASSSKVSLAVAILDGLKEAGYNRPHDRGMSGMVCLWRCRGNPK